MARNTLLYGDNLSIMQGMAKHSVDLIYLDPPFKSEQNYNLIYKTLTGQPVPEQAEAFCDTWEMDAEKEKLAKTMPSLMHEHGIEDYYVEFWRLWIRALRETQPHLLAYLIYMVQRLLHMKSILKPTGSIYLHCDPTASHYIKVMMDGIFGHNNFRSEIIWRRTNAHNKLKHQYGPIHDTILFYTVSDEFTFHPGRIPYSKAYIEDRFRYEDERGRYQKNYLTGPGTRNGESGKEWGGFDPTGAGRHWAIPRSLRKFLPNRGKGMSSHEALDALYDQDLIVFPKKEGGQPMYKQYVGEGVPYQDIWAYQPNTHGVLYGTDDCIDQDVKYLEHEEEKLGYETQKPVGVLKRIIETSSNPGDVVFDPFCGCGTTVYAAHELDRQWIGCDIAILAVRLVESLLLKRYNLVKGEDYEEHGIPNSVESAKALWNQDPFQFEHWAVEYIGGFPTKKTGDRGIDGRIYYEMGKKLGVMALSVKGGKSRPTDVRDLRGVVSDEPDVYMGGFITMNEPTRGMKKAAAEAGMWEYRGVEYPRVQILTVRDFVREGRRFQTPTKLGSKAAEGQLDIPIKP